MKLSTAFKIYPKAITWSLILSSCIIMEGYDTAILGSFWAFPPFLRDYGIRAPDGTLTIPPSWQNGLGAATNCGEVVGLQIAGLLSERVGYRWTLISALVSITGFIFVLFFSNSLGVLLAGEFLCGIPWGVFQTMTIAYAAEVCPVPLRHYLTAYVNLCVSKLMGKTLPMSETFANPFAHHF
jgi:SP family general alpha glucoside:H+ symporter-like MFS transporter